LAWADTESGGVTAQQGLRIAAEAIGYGALAGAVVGALVATLLTRAIRAGWTGGAWEQVVPVGAALTSYALADWLGGSGFIAAFVGGLIFGSLVSEHEQVERFLEEAGGLTNAATFVVLGAVLVIPSLDSVDPAIVVYAALSLTAVRMIPVTLALIGMNARRPTVSFLGWFGPRGLASLVFVVIVQDSGALAHSELIVSTAVATVVLSVFAHGMTAIPLVNRYATWYHAHEEKPEMESEHVHLSRWRGQPTALKEIS
jgi:NhaP-type Na+/H+ or K+/H+ antiporter